MLLGPEYFTPESFKLRATGMVVDGAEGDLMERVRACADRDERVVKAFKELGPQGGSLRGEEWSEEEGVITWNGKVYVPRDPQLRHDIVRHCHDTPIVGHPGRWKTLEMVQRFFWWPGVSRYVAAYVKSCDLCNRTKTYPAKPAGRLVPNAIPTSNWQIVSVDMIPGLPESQGYNTIWIAVDRKSKRIRTAPCTTTIDSLGNARLFRDHVWRNHGIPEGIISDRGSQFVSELTQNLSNLLGIKIQSSTSFHPQTDGQTERVNQEIEAFLRIFVNERQNDWADWLPIAEFAYNNAIHSSTRATPFQLDMGRHPRMGFEPHMSNGNAESEEFVQHMQKASDEAQSALKQAADDMKRFYDRTHRDAMKFKAGDKVWLSAKNISTTRPTKKLDWKWLGPYEVIKPVGELAYLLRLPPGLSRLHPVFHVSLLRPSTADTIDERPQYTHPEPELDGDEVVYEVESVVDSRRFGRSKNLQYRIQWKGYGPDHDTWEPAENLEGSSELIEEFHIANPGAPRQVPRNLGGG